MKLSGLILLMLTSFPTEAQSIFLELLYTEAKNVFRAKVDRIRYEGSNGEGSYFGVSLAVEEVYKGDHQYETVSFGLQKIDVIDLELDTVVLDYGFQITEGQSYFFFTKEIHAIQDRERKGITSLAEEEIEGVPFSPELEQVIKGFDPHTFLSVSNDRNYPSNNWVFNTMKSQADSIFLGELIAIRAEGDDTYVLRVGTSAGEREVVMKKRTCICPAGEVKLNGKYLFYGNRTGEQRFRLLDEWLGVIVASEYDLVKWSK